MARPRDPELDAAVLAAATGLLVESGIGGVTYEAVAERAGTSRPAVYRRFATHTDLVVAALSNLQAASRPEPTGSHRRDLVAELRSFAEAITGAASITLVGSVLVGDLDERVLATYRQSIVVPRRQRLTAILAAAATDGELVDDEALRRHAVTMCTGSWYAFALAGEDPSPQWPERTADLVWRSLAVAA